MPAAIAATNLKAVLLAFGFFHLPTAAPDLQMALCVGAALALVGAAFRVGLLRIAIFVPQHLLLGGMAWGGLLASYQGNYLDGTSMAWVHINADQVGYVALFVVHSSAIVRRCRDPNG
jgi:hypothetical protein